MTPKETARQWLADPLAVVLDFETTGWAGYACEVAVVGMDGAMLLHTRINPGVAIEAGAMAVHGIRQDDVADAPCWHERILEITELLHRRNVIAYGAPFDMGVYEREMKRCSAMATMLMRAPLSWRCAMQLWRQHAGLKSTVKLETLVPTADHSALGDARACLELVRRVAGVTDACLPRIQDERRG